MDNKEVYESITRTESNVMELVKQGAVHNELLRTHEARSLALQKKQEDIELELQPIKEHVNLMSKGLKAAGLIAVGALTQWLFKAIF